jgi:hypothetical protein
MQITYGHPASGGPTRFVMYDRNEVIKHLILSSNEAKEHQRHLVGSTKYQIKIFVDGILPAAVFAAALLRTNNVPLKSTYYDKEEKALVIGYDEAHYKNDFTSYIEELFRYGSLLDLKRDIWGNNLFINGDAIV